MSFCRITGNSRALPKPHYFPLLPPISPADAKRFCRITSKAVGLPSHHYIPVILTTLTTLNKCKITNVSDELGPHHFIPNINFKNRKHIVLADYRYVFPLFDETDDLQKVFINLLNSNNALDDRRYVYTVDERRCSLVFPSNLEAAVRNGHVRDVMLAKNCDSVLLKLRQGENISVDLQKYDECLEELYDGEGPCHDVLLEREKEKALLELRQSQRFDRLSDLAKIFENKERYLYKQLVEHEDQINRRERLEKIDTSKKLSKSKKYFKTNLEQAKESLYMNVFESSDLVKPILESLDWDTYEKEVLHQNYNSITKQIPEPYKLDPVIVDVKNTTVSEEILDNTTGFDCVPCIGPLHIIKEEPEQEILVNLKNITQEKLKQFLNWSEKILEDGEMLNLIPTTEEISNILKNFEKGIPEVKNGMPTLSFNISAEKKVILIGTQVETSDGIIFVPGQSLSTSQGTIYIPGLIIKTPNGVSFVPGQIITSKNDKSSPIFMAGQIINNKFIRGQTFNVGTNKKFVEGQTVVTAEGLKFVPGVIDPKSNSFVAGQELHTPDGVKFIPGQTMVMEDGNKFIPGQTTYSNDKGWEFVPGQIIKTNGTENFVPGKTIITSEGAKFVPGQYVGRIFIPGITVNLQFVPGLTVETKQGPKFIEGQIVDSNQGQIFMPGKSNINKEGHVEFVVAKTVKDVVFTEPLTSGYVIDINSSMVSNQCLSVYGFILQTKDGIEFYPEKINTNFLSPGKRIPGKLIKQDDDTKFVPGIMENGGFIPGQFVWTEKGEQFVPGQVIETSNDFKFVPGQIIKAKTGSKFVPGQTMETLDGHRFIPGQILHTKAGPTFIPGQVIYTEEGERFVPGQLVDTESGPRFVPGRVIENGDKVTFLPGQIVQTSEGPKFVAPDLIDNEDGEQQYSVQSFLVSPEELSLLKPTHTWNQSSTKGELSIDSKMLRQLSEAGMTIGRQTETSTVDIVLQSTKNTQIMEQIMEKIGINKKFYEIILQFIQSIEKVANEIIRKNQTNRPLANAFEHINHFSRMNGEQSSSTKDNGNNDERQEFVEAIMATIETVVKTHNQKWSISTDLSIFEMIGKCFQDSILHLNSSTIKKLMLSSKLRDEIMRKVHQSARTLYGGGKSKKDILHELINKEMPGNFELVSQIASTIDDENLRNAFLNITEIDSELLYRIFNIISANVEQLTNEEIISHILQSSIVTAVKESANSEIKMIFTKGHNENVINLLMQSLSLSKALGLVDVVEILNDVINGNRKFTTIFENTDSIDVLQRTVIINKLAKVDVEMSKALMLLLKNPFEARRNSLIRKLIRQSGIVTIIPDEKFKLIDSKEIPISLFDSDNVLAMEDFLLRRQTKNKGAFLIVKKGLQAVVPRESSRDILTGKCAYTVLDENGIRHFEPLHVFSALKLNSPSTAHRFSLYSCDMATDDFGTSPKDFKVNPATNCSSLSYYNFQGENISTGNTEMLATRRKIRALLEEGKVNKNLQTYRNFLRRIQRQLSN